MQILLSAASLEISERNWIYIMVVEKQSSQVGAGLGGKTKLRREFRASCLHLEAWQATRPTSAESNLTCTKAL